MAIKKNNRTGWYITAFVLVLLCAGSYILTKYIKEQRAAELAEAAVYAAFGIDMPSGYLFHGIDVSSHQNVISWPAVKKMDVNGISISFAFMKATEGLKDTDKFFKKNWLNAKLAGLHCGAYHFFLSTKDGAKQASNFIATAGLQAGDFPPVVDIEELYGVKPKIMQQRLKQCLDSLKKHYRVKPILYTYVDFYKNNLGKDFDNYPLWIAHYDEPEKPRITRNWWFWQHSQEGHINGITTFVDCNVFNGDSVAFQQIFIP